MGDRTADARIASLMGALARVQCRMFIKALTGVVAVIAGLISAASPSRADTIATEPVEIGALCPTTAATAGAVLTSPHRIWLRPRSDGDRAGTASPTGSHAADLRDRLRAADIALLGEIHDNPAHHQLQACLLEAMADRKPVVVWEQVTVDQADALAAFLETEGASAEGLGPAVRWEARGWPSWAMYQPIAEVAFRNGLAMRAANARRDDVRNVARQGFQSLDDTTQTRLKLDRGLSPDQSDSLRAELAASHCDLMPASAFTTMADAQVFRDAQMAERVVAAHREIRAPAVLITGNGHVRRDRGVPWHLQAHAPDAEVFAVGILEVTDPDRAMRDISDTWTEPGGAPAFDAVIFTAPHTRPDPCVEMRKRFGKHKG